MIGKLNQASLRPTLQGVMAQSSTYGAAIPRIYGTAMTSPLLIWLNGIRKSGSNKKGSKKTGASTYRACADLLLGHNPILTVYDCIASNVQLGVDRVKLTGVSGPSYTIVDADFYTVVGVTVTLNYNVTFNDYGSTGSSTLSGSYELPLWNLAMQGPNPVNPSGSRFFPYTYYNLPGSPVVSQLVPPAGSINIYYARLKTSGWKAHTIPLTTVLNASFESSLGDGTAYTGYKDFTAQRIVYPWYAGIGSFNFDIGMGAAPQIRMAVQGAYGLYPDADPANVDNSADADYADMIEDVFRQGQTQAAILSTGIGTATAQSPIQVGLSCYELPGTVQKKFYAKSITGVNFSGSMQFDLPVTKGNVLVAAVASAGLVPLGLTDTLGNSWSASLGANGKEFWRTVANASGLTTLNFTGVPVDAEVMIFEIGGADSIDSVSVSIATSSSLPTGTVATTNTNGQSGYILVWAFPDSAADVGSGVYKGWSKLVAAAKQGGNFFGLGPANSYAQYRRVASPGSYTFTGDVATATWTVVMLAVKNAVVPNYPKPLGDVLDQPSLDLCRIQARANGLFGSLNMNSQKKGGDWLADIYLCMNSTFVWSGFKGKSIPWSEVSFAGNGAIYTAPTASGPIADLTADDSIGDSKQSWITIERTAVVDRPDLLRIQHPERAAQYNQTVVSQPEVGPLSLFGLRQASPKVLDMVYSVSVARMLLGIMVRRQNYIVRKYKFTLKANWKLLEAMDLITLTDPLLGLNQIPVRLTSISEDDKFQLACEAEDFIYGVHDPTPLPITGNQASGTGSTVLPAAVNAPVFLEPPAALTGSTQDELWIVVSDADPAYGGAVVYVSVDGGASYTQLGIVTGNGVTGFTTADWPQALDPDTTNDLSVDLTESTGVLQQYSVTQEDQFLFPCYVAGAGIFPFELMTYAVANLTSAYHYTLKATGGGGNKLRRAAFGTWVNLTTPNTGSDHPMTSRFAFLDPADVGAFKTSVPNAWIGKTLFFKFVQFNQSGSGYGTLAAATAYSYTIIGNGSASSGGGGTGGSGSGGASSYTINPANPLTNPNSTTIDMAAVTATFSPSNLVTHYNARVFTIPNPGATPQIYYVTVFDPNSVGDTGSGTNLTAYCQTTQAAAFVGQPGYIYMGSILAIGGGGGTASGGGSNPPPASNIQIPIPSTTAGDFTIAHGMPSTPADVDIKIQSNGLIRFQSPTMWDATNVYLNASDDGLTGTLVIEP